MKKLLIVIFLTLLTVRSAVARDSLPFELTIGEGEEVKLSAECNIDVSVFSRNSDPNSLEASVFLKRKVGNGIDYSTIASVRLHDVIPVGDSLYRVERIVFTQEAQLAYLQSKVKHEKIQLNGVQENSVTLRRIKVPEIDNVETSYLISSNTWSADFDIFISLEQIRIIVEGVNNDKADGPSVQLAWQEVTFGANDVLDRRKLNPDFPVFRQTLKRGTTLKFPIVGNLRIEAIVLGNNQLSEDWVALRRVAN